MPQRRAAFPAVAERPGLLLALDFTVAHLPAAAADLETAIREEVSQVCEPAEYRKAPPLRQRLRERVVAFPTALTGAHAAALECLRRRATETHLAPNNNPSPISYPLGLSTEYP